MNYEVKNWSTKSPHVAFYCPTCANVLKAPLSDAGKPDTCPECNAAFTVPGKDHRLMWEQKQASDEEERKKTAELRRQKADEERRRKEAKRQEDLRKKSVDPTKQGSPTSRRSIGRNYIESIILALGAVGILVGGHLSFPDPDESDLSKPIYFDRFQSDNAYGATANAVETLALMSTFQRTQQQFLLRRLHAERQRTLYTLFGLVIAGIAANTLRRERLHYQSKSE